MPDFGPNDLDAFWMPFTPNRRFKAHPRMLSHAEGMHYRTPDGRQILDATSGLWCVNAGHNRPKIVEAIRRQAGEMDYAPSFNMGHPAAFAFAGRIAQITPPGLDRIFFTGSGSESVDTALKIALAYHRARGKGTKTRLIGRERGYHGVGFGGISVGGIPKNRMYFGSLLTGVDHLPHTHGVRGQPVQPGPAQERRRAGRRPGGDRRPARRQQHRRRDRRAGGRLDRRAGPTRGLFAAPAGDLRQARHPADLR
jgi:beta-alanine--pyruvate transaminase